MPREISDEEFDRVMAAYEAAGGDERTARLQKAKERSFLMQLAVGKERVRRYLVESEQKALVSDLDKYSQELAAHADSGINNLFWKLPLPRNQGFYLVDGGQRRLRKCELLEVFQGKIDLDKVPEQEPGKSEKFSNQPYWRFFADMAEAVRDLGMDSTLNMLHRVDRTAQEAGAAGIPTTAFDRVGIPVYLLMRIRGYSDSDLTA